MAAESTVRLVRPSSGPDPRTRTRVAVPVTLALCAGLARLPFLGMPLAPDEGGYLVVASQWHPGASTYGAYFVDRPPLLVTVFAAADALGGTTALRLFGIAAVIASVLLAAAIGGAWAAGTAAVFLTTPLFGTTSVDGELLAVPLVPAGILMVVRATRATEPTERWGGMLAAGALAASAALVKQNMVDVVVFAVVSLAFTAVRRGWREATVLLAGFAGGAAATAGLALWLASMRGTSPSSLWDALVTFRAQAAAVIDANATDATPDRMRLLLLALLLTGAPLVVGVSLAASGRRRHGAAVRTDPAPGMACAGVAVLVWELTGAALGGSYWLHYLTALVPGLVVLVAAVEPTRWVRGALVFSGVSAAIAWSALCLHPPGPGSDQAVSAYVRTHAHSGDTMLVAFGHPNIVRDAGLTSPYPHLWSLSVRVRDPQLTALTGVIEGLRAPRWVVVADGSLATWGVDEVRAQQVFARHYVEVTSAGDWHVFERH